MLASDIPFPAGKVLRGQDGILKKRSRLSQDSQQIQSDLQKTRSQANERPYTLGTNRMKNFISHINTFKILLFANFFTSQVIADDFSFEHEHILGTSLKIEVHAPSREVALAAEARILAEIDRLATILSNHDPESEFRRWQAAPVGSTKLSPELFEVMQESDRWRELSGGAFHPAVQSLLNLWAACAKNDRLPTPEELKEAQAVVARPLWRLDRLAGTAGRLTDAPLTLDAIAKGYIIDRAAKVGLGIGEAVEGLLIEIGGDLLALGNLSPTVGIADPRDDTEASPPLARIKVQDRAVATSGGHRRGFEIGEKHYSHLIDPRTGRPAEGILSASVVAPKAADADVLATILCFEPITEGLRLVDSLPDVECLIVAKNGEVGRSRGWPGLELERTEAASTTPPKPEGFEMLITFEIQRPEGRGSYRRPYVAIWVEDENNEPVRTLVLWVQAIDPGPRWIPDLRRWFRSDRQRKLNEPLDLVSTVSRATRPPGQYQVLWDRLDQHGKPLPDGQYTLLIEAAREHGTYQVMRVPLNLGTQPFVEKVPGNVEIGSAKIEYRQRQTPVAD